MESGHRSIAVLAYDLGVAPLHLHLARHLAGSESSGKITLPSLAAGGSCRMAPPTPRETVYGPEHVNVARVLRNLGDAYGRATSHTDPTKAETLLLKPLRMQEALLGSDDAEVAETLFELVSFYRTNYRSAEAEEFNVRALKLANIRQDLVVYGTNRRSVEIKDGWISTYRYSDDASDRLRFGSALAESTADQALVRSERRADGIGSMPIPLAQAGAAR
jgi:hypothetical protein